MIHGGMRRKEQRKAQESFRHDPEVQVLLVTDAAGEGSNLYRAHLMVNYDLPWNPNRLKQREGRVHRYGQPARRVKAVRFFGWDNPRNGVVIEVVLDKARHIHRTLGTHVPVPEESDRVTQAVLKAIFLRGGRKAAGRSSRWTS